MSHTNSTTNYNLPQFVGTDKPAWLTDINGAFSATDTAIKAAKDVADTAAGDATTANNSIGTLSNLNTTEKTNLVGAINEVNVTVGTVSGVATQASGDATNALTQIGNLASAFNMTQFTDYPAANITASGMSTPYGNLHIASNADGSIGKIYGFLGTAGINAANAYYEIDTPFRPTTDITIADACLGIQVAGTQAYSENVARFPVTISTTGKARILCNYPSGRTYNLYLPPCLYFMKDFGDTANS